MFLTFKVNKFFVSVGFGVIGVILALIPIVSVSVPTAKSDGVKVVVLMYHGLREDVSAQNKYVIAPSDFEGDLKYLKNHGYNTITVSDLTAYFEDGTPLPSKPVMLTFDDGYYNNYTYAYPLLKKYNMKAIISPIGITVDEYQENQDENPAYAQINWDNIREMSESGLVEFQNHTYNLHKIKNGTQGAAQRTGESDEAYEKRLTEDLQKLNDRFEEEVGFVPSAVVFPFGALNEKSVEIVKKMGFKAVMDCENKANSFCSAEDLYAIHRFIRPNNISSKDFFENTVKLQMVYA